MSGIVVALIFGLVAFASNGRGKFGSQDVINALGGFYKDGDAVSLPVGSLGSKSGPSPPNSCLLSLVSWLSSFFAMKSLGDDGYHQSVSV